MSIGAVPLIPPLPEYEKKTDIGTTVTTGGGAEQKKFAPEQTEAIKGLDEVTADQIAGTDEVRKQKEAEAAISKDMAAKTAEQSAEQERLTNQALDQTAKARDAAIAQTKAEQAKLDAMSTPKFFRDGDTWGNALRAFAGALAGAGDAMMVNAAVRTGHAPPAVTAVHDLVEADLARQKEAIQRQSDRVVRARTGIADAQAARERLLADIDLRGAAAYKRLEDIGKARLAALGLNQAQIDQHQAILSIRAARAQKQADYVAPMFQSIKSTWDKATKTGTEETNRQQGGQKQSPVGAADVEHVNQLQTDIAKLDRTIELMEKDPSAAEAWRANEEKWRRNQGLRESTLGKLGQAAGAVNIAPEQGLKDNPAAKQIHQGMAQVGTSIAKGYGGVITEGDRQAASSEMASLANDPAEQVASLKRTRDLLKTKLDTFQQNRGVTLPSPVPSAAPAATEPPPFVPNQPPPGAPTARDRAIQAVKANPSDPRAVNVRKYWKITDEELR